MGWHLQGIICHCLEFFLSQPQEVIIVDVFLYTVFLIMSQVTVTNTTTTPLVIVSCSGALLITMPVIMALTSVGQTLSGQHDVVLLAHHYVIATTASVLDAFSGKCQLCHGSSACEFSLSQLSLPLIYTLVSVTVFTFCFQVPMWLPCSPMRAVGVCNATTPWSIPLAGICASW